jgi:2,4-dienoyl-CoA reductase-like NADH-dependent reductase (Old Yellow Enzyme family)
MKALFDQTQLAGMTLKNRFIRSATYDGFSDENGHMTEALFQVYENLAKGGVGTIITGLTYVSDLEESYQAQMGIYDDSFIEEYKKLTEMSHQYNARIIVQLVSLGSQASPGTVGKVMWGPSAVTDLGLNNTPQEMTAQDIRKVQQAFAEAALRAKRAGFDGVQMHVAHGYLLSKFLTPYYNRRSDGYGGTIENRARMVLETYQAIRDKVGPDYPVLIKINCDDFMDQGMAFADCKYVCHKLAEAGVSAIEISGGIPASRPGEGTIRKVTTEQESYFKSYAAEIAQKIKVPVILVGGNRTFDSMSEILNQTDIEYFALCRPLIRESDLINRWYYNGDLSRAKCVSCTKCFRLDGTRCIFNRK